MEDLINGIFELCGGFFCMFSVKKLYKDKKVFGISWIHVIFFTSWGYWNLFYYPALGQWLSFAGGVLLVLVNTIYTVMLIYYNRVNRMNANIELLD